MTPPTPEFGSIEETKILDDNGSTVVTKKSFRNGKVSYPVRTRYTYREKVHSKEERETKLIQFANEVESNVHMLDPSTGIEGLNKFGELGYYFITKSYTLLFY